MWDAERVPSSPAASVKSISLARCTEAVGWLLLSFMNRGMGRLGRDGCRLLLLLSGQVLLDPVLLLLKMIQAASEGQPAKRQPMIIPPASQLKTDHRGT